MSYILSAVDTSSIQRYIFGSNRLREHVGASELVLRATREWIWETLRSEKLRINSQSGDQPRDDSKKIEDGDLDAEVIYAAGGNALILFKDSAQAHSWARRLSKKALTDAPGLTLLVAHSDPFLWNPNASDIGDRVKDLFSQRLDTLKRTRVASAPLLGLGVTATCQSTGLVATEIDSTDNIRVSREVAAKTAIRESARKRFRSLLFDYEKLGLKLPEQLDDLNPNKGERSYITVVHADGNGIGKLFQNIWDSKNNRDGIRDVRQLSDAVSKLASDAFQHALAGLITKHSGLIEPYSKTFPVRPLIYGGDDLTFVCDGRIGVGLAARYLGEFENRSKSLPNAKLLPNERLTAAAGIAIVKTHYPFARAYQLSEQLCHHAKHLSREQSTLDWHVSMSGTLASINDIRQREYHVDPGNLAMRPVYLREAPKLSESWRTWQHVEEIIAAFNDPQGIWYGKRNKIKQLREVLRDGADAVEQFRVVYRTGDLPGYQDTSSLKRKGWVHGECGYFDPIELLDLYVSPFTDANNKEAARWLPTT